MKANNYKIIKHANKYLVMDTIMNYGPITTEDIIYRTRLSRPTIINILKDLTTEHYVFKSGFAESNVGRQPALYALNPSSYYAIGIDFDFPPARLAISNLQGDLVYSHYWEFDADDDVSRIVPSFIDNIRSSIREAGIDQQFIVGLGIGLPAIINNNQNAAVIIDRIRDWHNIPLDEIINSATGLTVYIRNDAHLLGMVEKSFLDKDINNLLYIVQRSGIGAAVFINNNLYEGNFGNSGYIGHTSIDFNGELCECGNLGCLELYSSKRAIVNQYKKQKGIQNKISFDEIVERSIQGDDIASKVLFLAGRCLGIGISNAIKLYDISNVVLGDSVKYEDNLFFKSLKESVDINTSHFNNNPITISLGKLEKDSYGLGGCHFVLNQFLKKPQLKLNV